MYYIERKKEELERRINEAESKQSKPNYQWTLSDYLVALARKIANRRGDMTRFGLGAQCPHRAGYMEQCQGFL